MYNPVNPCHSTWNSYEAAVVEIVVLVASLIGSTLRSA